MRCRTATLIVGLAMLVFGGFLFWAKARDPFARVWFTIKSEGEPRAECVAVLPKTVPLPYPVIVYLHGSGGSLQQDGNDLRQMAEMGLAAVGMDYCQTNDAVGEAQLAALLRYLGRQKWADTNAMGWVGFSLGAEKVTRFWLKNPEARPQLLVRLAGGWIPELETGEHSTTNIQHSTSNRPSFSTLNPQPSTVLILHSEQDEVFPVADAERVAGVCRTNGVAVDLRRLHGVSHHLGADRALIFRVIGEYCVARLRGPDALAHYRSIGDWQAGRWPLWVFWLPALAWGSAWAVWCRPRHDRSERLRAGRWMRWVAVMLALAALAVTAVHLGAPRLAVNERTLALARWFLVQPQERGDFEYLASSPCWSRQRLRALLEHAHLVRYNRSLVNWKPEDAVHREFVLSPVIGGEEREDLRWRRVLWESLYPRIRKEQTVAAAAEVVVRHLRERVTVVEGGSLPDGITDIWRRQTADEAGFQRLMVAGLRSVGIAARWNGNERAEVFTDAKWKPAPRPIIERW